MPPANEDRSSGAEATPFMVEVTLDPDRLSALVLMIGTVLPATPFTVVDKVLALEVLLTEFTIGTVLPVTPFTVVDRVLAFEVLPTEFTAAVVAATPLTVLVIVLTGLVSVLDTPMPDAA